MKISFYVKAIPLWGYYSAFHFQVVPTRGTISKPNLNVFFLSQLVIGNSSRVHGCNLRKKWERKRCTENMNHLFIQSTCLFTACLRLVSYRLLLLIMEYDCTCSTLLFGTLDNTHFRSDDHLMFFGQN